MLCAKTELEKRSKYHSQIKQDVIEYGDMINGLAKDIRSFGNECAMGASDDDGGGDDGTPGEKLSRFLDGVDAKLCKLVDENAVLKNFENFPIQKVDLMRETVGLNKELLKFEVRMGPLSTSPSHRCRAIPSVSPFTLPDTPPGTNRTGRIELVVGSLGAVPAFCRHARGVGVGVGGGRCGVRRAGGETQLRFEPATVQHIVSQGAEAHRYCAAPY